jgi:dCMP deaminase
MKSQADWDRFYMDVAERAAQMSYATDRKVGAVIEKDGNIISFSYNGTPAGTDNETQKDGRTLPHTCHAEVQAILKVARSTMSTSGATIYSTCSPCIECAKAISESGIRRAVFRDLFKDPKGLTLLEKRLGNHNVLAEPEWLRKTGLL